ncbi:uncharacterized protein [Parasteatoda tepidariorum]|uniref:uncharacterized protein n=1 Tax=Parasteatoda tepidariorum TaxID=114398 RepID=UPI0039BD3C4F
MLKTWDEMVRNYKRKTNRGMNFNWSEDNLHAAIYDIRNSVLSTHKAAQTYAIPEATLRRYLKKDDWANISGPYSSGAKLKNVDANKPSTSTRQELLPDVGVFQGLPDMSPPNAELVYNPNIIIKQEIIETEVDPSNILDVSTFDIDPSENPFADASNMPSENLISPNVAFSEPLSTSENMTGKSQSEVEVTSPITSVGLECNSVTPVKSSKRYNETDLRKVFVKKNTETSPSSSGSSSEDEDKSHSRRDKFDAYAEFIASKLRDLDPRSCAFVQTAIADLIFEAELGRFLSEGDKSIFADKTQELLKHMPPPRENES